MLNPTHIHTHIYSKHRHQSLYYHYIRKREINMNIPVNVDSTEEIKERHRQEFNTNVFPYLLNGENPTDTSRKELTQEQWQDMVNTIKVLQPDFVIEENPDLAEYYENLSNDAQRLMKWKKKENRVPMYQKYKVDLDPNTNQERLYRFCLRKNFENRRWLLCLPSNEIFDAIWECHLSGKNHRRRKQTIDTVHDEYYNITEKQVLAFIDCCEECKKRSSENKNSVSKLKKMTDEDNNRIEVLQSTASDISSMKRKLDQILSCLQESNKSNITIPNTEVEYGECFIIFLFHLCHSIYYTQRISF